MSGSVSWSSAQDWAHFPVNVLLEIKIKQNCMSVRWRSMTKCPKEEARACPKSPSRVATLKNVKRLHHTSDKPESRVLRKRRGSSYVFMLSKSECDGAVTWQTMASFNPSNLLLNSEQAHPGSPLEQNSIYKVLALQTWRQNFNSQHPYGGGTCLQCRHWRGRQKQAGYSA